MAAMSGLLVSMSVPMLDLLVVQPAVLTVDEERRQLSEVVSRDDQEVQISVAK